MTSKVTNFIKQYFFLLALVGLTIGFTAANYPAGTKFATPQWYEVEIINPANPQTPSNLRITGLGDNPPSSSETECALQNQADTCMVRLDLEEFDGDAEDLISQTVAFAEANDAPVLPQSGDDGYAKQPEEN